jgi:hypothetical protein
MTEVFLNSDWYIVFKYFGPICRWRIEMAHLPAALRILGLLGFWLRPSSGILKNTKEHSILETGTVSFLKWAAGRHLLYWVH